jgi:uncharacterized protein YceH (UPF0502 family)
MNENLNDIEIRILGCLIEKEMATPEYYPLSLNALLNACNQKSNREPVVQYDETTVIIALDSLIEKKYAWRSDAGRVTKYSQNFVKTKNILDKEAAIICLLLLRGPQTLGELRGRSERLYRFDNLEEVQEVLDSLMDMDLATRLPKQPGRKEARYAQLLSGTPDIEQDQTLHNQTPSSPLVSGSDSLDHLKNEITALREELQGLRNEFIEFKKQFE